VLGDVQELTSASFHPIGVAEESVPAGRYARSALEKRGIWEAVKGNLRQAENVRGVVAWASRGDVKVGIVYTSDARDENGIETIHVIPKSLHPEIVYPAAVTSSSSHKKEAGAFIQFCTGGSAREIARRHGFDPR
jgi:molybdate transport system substrate-binding protein